MRAIRYAWRTLLQSPAFFLVAVGTLGLGIAANTAMFSLFYQVLLATLPVPNPQQLVVLHSEEPNLPGGTSKDNAEVVFSYPMYRRLRNTSKSFEGLVARSRATVQMGVDGSADRVRGEVVSGNFFEALKVRPAEGRLLTGQDDTAPGTNRVAVLSYDFWVSRFGSNPVVLNRTVLLNTQPFTVVGVAPRGFRGVLSGETPDLYLPISAMMLVSPGWNNYEKPGSQWLNVIGRLRNGVRRDQALAELQPLFVATIQDHVQQLKVKNARALERLAAKRVELRPAAQGLNELERQWRSPLVVLLAMASVLLLIACVNLANLLAVRATNRSRELGVRLALGATRGQIAGLLLAESAVLAVCGTLAGLLGTPLMNRLVLAAIPKQEISGWVSTELNWAVLAFSALVMIVVTVLCGLVPSLQAIRGGVQGLGERAAGAGRTSAGARRMLVTAQVALSMALLVTAGLFARSLSNLMRHNPGFRADSLMTLSLDAGLGGYSTERGLVFYEDIARKLRAVPGVRSVTITEAGPLGHSDSFTNVMVEGYTPKDDENMDSRVMSVGPDYFRTLGTALLQGREFEERDGPAAPKVAIVNQAFLRRFFGGQHALGRHMSMGAGGPLDITIVGEVEDVQNANYRDSAGPAYYMPYAQSLSGMSRMRRAAFFVRAPEGMAGTIRSVVAAGDRTVPVYGMETMTARVADSMFTDRVVAGLATAFGALALLLTAVGLYGVIAYLVSRRTTEFGVRIALGATQGTIVGSVLKEAVLMLGAGGLLGLAAAYAAGRGLESQLFGIRAFDAMVFVAAPAILAAIMMFAASVPALRAARIEPTEALRHQ